MWQAEPLRARDSPAVRFRYHSPDGDQGYPGNLDVSVVFTLNDENELRIDYVATTDQPTPVNLTHHSYFNLAGQPPATFSTTCCSSHADRYTPTDAALIPTGDIVAVAGTPFDFRDATRHRRTACKRPAATT